MSLKVRIDGDLKGAMKARDSLALGAIRMLKAEIKNREIETGSELDDNGVMGVVASQVKKRRESIRMYEQGGRADLAGKESGEIDVLQRYLPEQMDEGKVRETVKAVIEGMGSPDAGQMGRVMKAVMAEIGKKADGGLVSRIVKELLPS